MARKPAARKSSPAPAQVNRMEWILAGLAAVAVLALFGYLVYDGLTSGQGGPLIELRRGDITGTDPLYLDVTVSNTGHGAAADLDIEGQADRPSGEPAAAHVTLDYAPAESDKSITLVFPADIDRDSIELHVAGFREP